jgi:zinc protease
VRAAWVGVVVFALGGAARAEDVPTKLTIRNVQWDVRTVDLPSGMRVVVEKDDSRPLVAVTSVVDVGGSDDPPGKEGLAHLVEHLAFRSLQSGKHPFNDLLEIAGASRWNASTSWDLTTYYEVGSKLALDSLLSLESARLSRPLQGVTPEVFEAERKVVKNELLQRDEQGVYTALFSRLSGAIFPAGHPNSRPVAGTEASIASLTLEDARAFVERFYRPERMTLLISGDVDPAALAKSLGEKIPAHLVDAPATGPVKIAARLPANPRQVEDPKSAREMMRVPAPSDWPIVYVGWPLPSGYDAEGYLGDFVARMVAGASSVAVGHDDDLVSVGAALVRGRSGSMLLCLGRLREGKNPARSAGHMIDELVRLWAAGVGEAGARRTDAAFQVRRNGTWVALASDLEDLGQRAVLRAQLVHVTGEPNAISRELRSIGELSGGKVASFAYEYLSRDRARVAYLEPDGTAHPDSSAGAFAASSALNLSFTPEVLKSRVAPPGAQLRTFTLDSGLEVILARRPTAPVVTTLLAVRGGEATGEPLGGPVLARFANNVDKTHGYPDLYGMRQSRRVVKDESFVELLAGNGNLPNALGMLLDRARSLHVDAAAERYIDRELRSVYRKDWARPQEVFQRAVWSSVYGTHPLGRTVTPDTYDKTGGSDAQRFIDRAFMPGNAVLVVAGDLELAEAEASVRSYFGGWRGKPDAPAYASGELVARPQAPVPLSKTPRPGARQTEFRLGCAIPMKTQEERAAAEVLAARLGGRMERFARQMLGATYGFSHQLVPRSGLLELGVVGSVDDAGAMKVLAIFKSEAENLGSRPLEAADFSRAQWEAGLAAGTRYESSSELARALARLRLFGLPVDTLERFPTDLAAVTPAAVQAVAAECRKTAALGLLGEQATLDRLVPSG